MLAKRVLTAFILIPLVVAIVLFTPTTLVALVTAIVTILALWEFFALGEAIGHRAYRLWTILCSLLFVFIQLLHVLWQAFFLHGESNVFLADYLPVVAPTTTPIFFFFVLGLTILILFSRRPLVEVLPASGISSSALLLIAFPLSYAVRLHGIPAIGPRLLLFALAIIWVADSAAYFVGRAIGKHPLAPHISPNKTWEGSIAAMLGSLLAAWAFHHWIHISLPHLLAMAACGNIAGQMGDLLESACKRSAGAKDSGGLLPGHGGVLDRIDALILCIPVIWYYLVLANPLTP
jgi:phosphatidate cytidylyltransferase